VLPLLVMGPATGRRRVGRRGWPNRPRLATMTGWACSRGSSRRAQPEGNDVKRWLWLSVLILLLDQITKWLVLAALRPYEVLPLAPNINLTLMFNTGAAFSFLSDAGGWQRWIFAGFALAVTLALVVWLLRLKPQEHWLAAALALIVGGAVGNLVDRLLLGHVVDFIQVYLPFLPFAIFNPWPAFNVADSAITVGVVLLLVESLRTHRQPTSAAGEE
jgi:signal peptidase II